MSTIAKFLEQPPDQFSTQISSATLAADGLTVSLDSTSGLPTEGVGQFFKKDANGNLVSGSVEFVHWTNVSGNTLTFSDTGDRGITGSDAGAQAYVADDYFEVWASTYYIGGVGGLVEHNADGTHGAITATSISVPTTGWTADTDTWVYASATTFTVAGKDVTAKFTKGTRLKFTQTTVKYAVVVASSFSTDTTVTIMTNTDYTIANATITSPNYSYAMSPQSYPGWFNVAAPTFDTAYFDDGAAGQPTTSQHKGRIDGNRFEAYWTGSGVKAGANVNTIVFNPTSLYPANAESLFSAVGTVLTYLTSNFYLHAMTQTASTSITSTTCDNQNIADNTAFTEVAYRITYAI